MSDRGRAVLKWLLAALIVVLIASVGYVLGRSGFNAYSPVASVAPERMSYGGAAQDEAAKNVSVPQMSVGAPSQDTAGASGETISATGIDKLVIKTAAMSVEVDEVDRALKQLRVAIARNDGEVSEMSLDAGSGGPDKPLPLAEGSGANLTPATAYVTIRVPATKLDALQRDVAKLGTVLNESAQSSDVTEQAIDLDARLTNLRAEEARLRTFLNDATKVSDLLAVERELARVRGEIESIDAQLTYLKRQAARSTLTVTLSEPSPVVSPAGPSWGFSEAITNGIRGAVAVVNTFVTALIALLPLAALVLIVWLIARPIARRRRAARASLESEPAPSDGTPRDEAAQA